MANSVFRFIENTPNSLLCRLHSFNQYLLSTYYVPDADMDAGDKQWKRHSTAHGVYIL